MQNLTNASASMHTLEQLADGKTVIHDLHPMAKMLTTAVYVVLVISFRRYDLSGLIPFVFYPVILMALSETPYKPLLQRMLVALPFSLFAGLSNLYFDRGTAFLMGTLSVSYGMLSFLSILAKTLLTVMAILILVATTSITQLSYQLVRMKIPAILVMQLTMTYRYISVLLEETFTMVTAYRLRSPKKNGIAMRDMGVFVGQLLLRSMDRAGRVYDAMKCRGFNGVCGSGARRALRFSDYLYMVLICSALIVMRFVNISILLGSFL